MSMFGWMRRMSLRLMGRTATGTNARNASEYGCLAIDPTTRSLYTHLRGSDGTERSLLTDSGGRLIDKPVGSANNPFLQDVNNGLVVALGVAPGSMLAAVHLSSGTDVLILSAPSSQVYWLEQTLIVNNGSLSADITLSRSTAGNTSRVFRGSVTPATTVDFSGPKYLVPGKPLRGGGATTTGVTVTVYGRRVR